MMIEDCEIVLVQSPRKTEFRKENFLALNEARVSSFLTVHEALVSSFVIHLRLNKDKISDSSEFSQRRP